MNVGKSNSGKEFKLLKKMESILDKKLIFQVQDLKENKNLITEIPKLTRRDSANIYKILKEKLNYVSYNRLVK